jgi:chromosome segregation protein
MYLSKLELLGFKSFAQKTQMKFTDGISCVIGPNGSGKSNIVDAIRWVLGEQKVSSLRTDRMESVIFSGTNDRKSLSMAEVNLTVHNNKNVLASEFSDVVISRRLYRSGESQYFINKSPCRLKDIQNLFMDTGMGANSYSVIELGMVENIISENPSDRRHLFEEAAGITKYKARRKSALRKMDLTQQDMSRIEDIISEISRNVNSLSRQVGKARRYLKFQEELKKLEMNLARFRYTHYIEDIEPLRKTLEEISLIKEDTSQQITLEEAILEEYKRELIQSEQKINHYSGQLREHDEKIHQIKEDKAIAETRSQNLMDNIHRNRNEIDELNEKIKTRESNLLENAKTFETAAKDLQALTYGYENQEKEANDLSEKLLEKKSTLDSLNQQYREQFTAVSQQKEITQQTKYQFSWNKEQIRIFESENEALSESKNGLLKKLDEISRIKNEKTDQKAKNEQKHVQLEGNQAKINQKIEQLDTNLRKCESQSESLNTQLSFFQNIISNYHGHLESTRALMMKKDQFPGIHGPISEIVTIKDQYTLALEVALGDVINYLVVDSVKTAQEIIKEVEEKKLGRVTIIPLDRIKSLNLGQKKYATESNSLGEYISNDSQYDNILQLLIGDVIVVETLDEAISRSEKNTELRYVTINGEIVNNNQAISGGQKRDPKTSLIGRKGQITTIEQTLSELKRTIQNNNQEREKKIEEQKAIDNEITELNQEIELLDKGIRDLELSEAEIQVQKQNSEESIEKREDNRKSTSTLLSRLEKELQESERTLQDMNSQLKSLEEKISNTSKVFSTEEEIFQQKEKTVKEIHVQLINASNHHQNLKADISRIKNEISESGQLQEKRKNEISEMEKELARIDEDSDMREKTLATICEDHGRIESEKSKIEQEYHEIKDKIFSLENQIKKYRKQHDSSLERTRHLELEIQENEMKSEAIRDRIKDEYNEDISVGIPFDGLVVEDSEQQIESLKYKIKQMGQVNPLAVSEFDRESERLEFFRKQYDDLKEAEKTLLETINKINITARKQFVETFQSIKENFERVFASFFVNGEGTLKMEENTDPLESNIEILVRPKGKQMQTISLLSGGEKTLTAISLLFSIYLVKPSPFCILDEIDAPLDDVNIGRFTQALKDFSNETQFIVVTHNKRTMESADTLYGVTMEEEGLSKLVSVKFN